MQDEHYTRAYKDDVRWSNSEISD